MASMKSKKPLVQRLKKNLKRPFRHQIAERQAHRDFLKFRRMASSGNRFPLRWDDRLIIANENTATTDFPRNYVYHTAWAARMLRQIQPDRHVDVSSSLYFSAIVSAFVPVDFYDYRPAKLVLNNFTSSRGDLTRLDFADASVECLSCMHVVEHIGLGRYGDPLDPDGDLKAIAELKRVVRPGGHLLFVVPTGQARICYNAHRVYGYRQVLSYFSEMQLVETALVTADGAPPEGLKSNAPEELVNQAIGRHRMLFVSAAPELTGPGLPGARVPVHYDLSVGVAARDV